MLAAARNDDVEEIERQESSSLRALYGLPNALVGSTKALRELINYFDHVISPVIVAFEVTSLVTRSRRPMPESVLRCACVGSQRGCYSCHYVCAQIGDDCLLISYEPWNIKIWPKKYFNDALPAAL